ncbi:Flp family type IVb pilin [Limimaricola pyoseonensis]|uniref:Flp pilus assembly protein, pilin Flp n=1 Tax=Limimaricola pyoseonensis TaxID=521013 RepID=A0A1G7DBM9_9RHOB|nr:hypothetical protein [Limimaricola pyoseonensis]SDE48971.1 hypothetical protein SAMN04488567_1868 [Limimaricola pyoseonensis]
MINFIKKFHNDESGAVTVDWVVLTAAIVGIGIAVMTTLDTKVDSVAATISADLDTAAGL